ncbi:MAG: hypothetical protein ACI4MQ_05720 [Candidatus Coproplasma sp.]
MKEEKHNRVVAAITVNAVLLVFILVAIVIAQIVQISVLNRRKQELQTTYAELMAEKKDIDGIDEQLEFDEKFSKWLAEYVHEYGELPDWLPIE